MVLTYVMPGGEEINVVDDPRVPRQGESVKVDGIPLVVRDVVWTLVKHPWQPEYKQQPMVLLMEVPARVMHDWTRTREEFIKGGER